MANYTAAFGFYNGNSPPPPPLSQTPFTPVAGTSPCREGQPSPLTAPASYCGTGPGVPSVPVPPYEAPSPYAAHGVTNTANFYPSAIASTTSPYIKDSDPWRGLSPAQPYYDATFTYGYSPAGTGFELQATRRKNVTRDSTSTLKAWLNEHKKNPYPSKGEKIMLAIITKMTLTQVSTWFANARRRLKKENKMTWEPRNKCDFDGDLSEDPQQPEGFQHHPVVVEGPGVVPQSTATSTASLSPGHVLSEHLAYPVPGGVSCVATPSHLATLPPHPTGGPEGLISPNPSNGDNSASPLSHSPKPRPGKIWSLADTATKRHEQQQQQHQQQEQQHLQQQAQHNQSQQHLHGWPTIGHGLADDHPGAGGPQQGGQHLLSAATGVAPPVTSGTQMHLGTPAHAHHSPGQAKSPQTIPLEFYYSAGTEHSRLDSPTSPHTQ